MVKQNLPFKNFLYAKTEHFNRISSFVSLPIEYSLKWYYFIIKQDCYAPATEVRLLKRIIEF